MGTTEKNKKGLHSQIAADLLVKSRGGDESSFDTSRLHEAIMKEIASHDEIFVKFRELLESFHDIIPEEKQRYQATIKALSCTSGLSRKDVLISAEAQLSELKKLEKGFTSALPNWRGEIQAMESKYLEIRSEVSRLREKISQLEIEEKTILQGMSSREGEWKSAEKGVENALTAIASEISGVMEKIEEFTPESVKSDECVTERSGECNIRKISDPQKQEVKGEKNCPMCGRQIKWHEREKAWKCFICSYEESETVTISVL